jgi:hypothetical protein
MIIPNKHSGYQAGIRVYPLGGGGGGGGESAPAPVAPPPPRLPSAAPAPQFQTYGQGDRTGSLVQSGAGMRPSSLDYSRPIFDPNYADNITGYEQSSQFYQPIYQPQYNNYTTTNPLGVSQYGTPMTARSLVDSAYAGVGRYGSGNETNQVDPGGRRYWENSLNSGTLNPQDFFNTFSGIVNQTRQNPNDRYGQYYQNQTGYSGSDFGRGYAQQPMPQMQTPFNPYTNNFGGGFGGGFGGFGGGFGGFMPQQQFQPQFMPQQQSPFSFQQQFQPQMNMGMQTPFSSGMSQAPRTSSGPAQAIVGRSSQMRGTPNVMRRAEGGIASLLDNDK